MDVKVVREYRTIDGELEEHFDIYFKRDFWPFWAYHMQSSNRERALKIAKSLSTPFLKEVIYDSRDQRS